MAYFLGTVIQQEHEENRILCERSVSLYRKWYKVFRSAGKPAAPSSIKLTSSSSNAITVQIGDVLDHGGAVVTKFKGYKFPLRIHLPIISILEQVLFHTF